MTIAKPESSTSPNESTKQKEFKEFDNAQNTSTVPFFTLWDYFKDELTASEFDNLQELKRERVTNFLGIPWSIEKLMIFGFFICLDSFLYTLTILPLRVIFAFYSLIMNFVSERKYNILNLSQICDLLKGLLIILVCIALQNVDASQIY